MKLAIKVDVDTYRGTREGVPCLCKILKSRKVPATFLFSLGPDNTGKSLCRIFQKGFLKKCLRSNVASNYGVSTLLYGTLLPAPKISAKCARQMRDCSELGFECGIHSWDHFKWQNHVASMRPTEIDAEFTRARAEFEKVFGYEAKCCGAPGWQTCPDALSVQDKAGLLYASDVRNGNPFFPKMGGEIFKTLQIPSTLPTLDELLGRITQDELAQNYFSNMQKREFSVMTIHAELEGMAYAEWFDSFLGLCKTNGVEFFSLSEYAKNLLKDSDAIPVKEIRMAPFSGRSGLLAVQEPAEN